MLTVLESAGPRLAKRITEAGIEPYDDAAYFTPLQFDPQSIHDLSKLLLDLTVARQRCIVRGTPVSIDVARETTFDDGKPPVKDGRYLRRAELFRDLPQNAVMIDIDGGEVLHEDLGRACAMWVERFLPPAFHEKTFHVQLSSSAGIKPGLRAHLWFWLETPATSSALKEWGKAWNRHCGQRVIDLALFSTVQIHYTADPEVVDPFGFYDLPAVRSLLVHGLFGDTVGLELAVAESVDLPDEFEAAFEALERQRPLADVDVETAREYLRRIPNTGDGAHYDDWLEVGMALHHQFGDGGLALWREWSQSSSKFDARDLERRWKSFRSRRGPVTTFAAVIRRAGGKLSDTRLEERAWQELRDRISQASSIAELATRVLHEVAKAEIDETLRDSLLHEIKARAKKDFKTTLSTPQLSKAVREARRQRDEDADRLATNLEIVLAELALEIHFGGGTHLLVADGNVWEFLSGHWVRLSDRGGVTKRVMETIEACLRRGDKIGRAVEAQLVSESERAERIGALAEAATKVLLWKVTTLDPDPLGLTEFRTRSVINTPNGEIWFDVENATFEVRDHDPANQMISQTRAPYVRGATAPVFEKMLKRAFSTEKDCDRQIEHFLELMAYGLMENRRWGEVFILWKSPGGSGKTAIVEVIQMLSGPKLFRTVSFAQIEKKGLDNHFSDSLVGLHFLIDDDFRKGATLSDDFMKRYSGQKFDTSNPKHGRTFQYVCRVLGVALSNHWPVLRDFSNGFRRRAHVFRAGESIPESERDETLKAHVMEHELSGVLNMLIEAYLRICRRKHLALPDGCRDALEEWLASGNSVMRFILEAVERTGEASDEVEATVLYDLYGDFCRHFEGNVIQLSRQRFYEALEESGLKLRSCRARARMLIGCRLKGEFERIINESKGGFG